MREQAATRASLARVTGGSCRVRPFIVLVKKKKSRGGRRRGKTVPGGGCGGGTSLDVLRIMARNGQIIERIERGRKTERESCASAVKRARGVELIAEIAGALFRSITNLERCARRCPCFASTTRSRSIATSRNERRRSDEKQLII